LLSFQSLLNQIIEKKIELAFACADKNHFSQEEFAVTTNLNFGIKLVLL